jgi:hypothetical protein
LLFARESSLFKAFIMRIRFDELIAGFPARKVGDLLFQNDEFLSRHDVQKVTGIGGGDAKRLFDGLGRKGCVGRRDNTR